MEEASPILQNREADEQSFQRCVIVVTTDRAIKSFEMTESWAQGYKPESELVEHSGRTIPTMEFYVE